MCTMFLAYINAKYKAGYQGLFVVSCFFDYYLALLLLLLLGE